jgi:hypothetical protein
LLPTPCPTKIPSATVKNDANTMDNNVGKKMLLNSGAILDFPKSILSLSLSFIFLAIILHQEATKAAPYC